MFKDCHHPTIQGTKICGQCEKPNDWQQHARCLDHDPEIWYPNEDDRYTIKQAIRICLSCPIRGFCLEEGWNEKMGIWGGFSPTDRITLRKVFPLKEEKSKRRLIIRTIAHRL